VILILNHRIQWWIRTGFIDAGRKKRNLGKSEIRNTKLETRELASIFKVLRHTVREAIRKPVIPSNAAKKDSIQATLGIFVSIPKIH